MALSLKLLLVRLMSWSFFLFDLNFGSLIFKIVGLLTGVVGVACAPTETPVPGLMPGIDLLFNLEMRLLEGHD